MHSRVGKSAALVLLSVAVVGCQAATQTSEPTTATAPATPGPATAEATADATEALYEAALEEGAVVWYESSQPEQVEQVAAAFREAYPGIEVQHVRLTGSEVGTRIITESQGGGSTGDVATSGLDIAAGLEERELVLHTDWTSLGVAPEATYSDFAVATADTPFVLAYNTDLVAEEDVPTSWEALNDPKWRGQIGAWVQPYLPASLAFEWGAERTQEWISGFMANEPVLMQSTFPVSQAVAAGELPMGLPVLHTTLPPADAGAPIATRFLEPVPNSVLATWVSANAEHPKAGQLFAAWLGSPEGNIAYESATGRGSRLIEGTNYSTLLSDIEISEPSFEDADQFLEYVEQFAKDWQ